MTISQISALPKGALLRHVAMDNPSLYVLIIETQPKAVRVFDNSGFVDLGECMLTPELLQRVA